jgi:hypothetical protein
MKVGQARPLTYLLWGFYLEVDRRGFPTPQKVTEQKRVVAGFLDPILPSK